MGIAMFSKERLRRLPTNVVEMVVIALATAVVYAISNHFDLYDFLHEHVSKYNNVSEEYYFQLDELIVVAIFLVPALGVFAWRRWSEVNALLIEREQDLRAVRAAKEQAESATERKVNSSPTCRTRFARL